jgi:DNA-binding MarR family transcriptional regulator
MQGLFRRFGALATESTPCGKPLSMAHAHALMVLLARGELSQRLLGAELRIDKSNVARLCARMVEAGHVRQHQSKDDGRSRRVSLSPRGERLAREVEVASSERFATLLAAVPSASRSQVLSALALLVAAVDTLPDVPNEQRNAE